MLRWSVLRTGLWHPEVQHDRTVGRRAGSRPRPTMWWPRPRGDIDDVLATIDRYAYEKSFLVNVGDEKGGLLDAAVRRCGSATGTGIGHLLRIRCAADRPRRTVGAGGLGGTCRPPMPKWRDVSGPTRVSATGSPAWWAPSATADAPWTGCKPTHGITAGALDFLFIDHDKNAYLADLQAIVDRGWLHPGSIVVADNVGFPGSPKYRGLHARSAGHALAHRRASHPRRVSDAACRTWCWSRTIAGESRWRATVPARVPRSR